MQTPPMNNTSKPTNEEEHGSSDTSKVAQLDPWDIAHLLICKRDEQPICIEDATDDEFDAWVHEHAIAVKENGIQGWSFDDRCRLVNYALAHGHALEFVDGTRIPEDTHADEEEPVPTSPLTYKSSAETDEPAKKKED
jgi:hypothetical protein